MAYAHSTRFGWQATMEMHATNMTPERAAEIVRSIGHDVEQIGDFAHQFAIDGVAMAIIIDANADRVRIIAPVADASNYTASQMAVLMEANYHSALDARYALSEGTIYAVFMHPLSRVGEDMLRSALGQVASLVQTYGTTFSSLDVVYPRN